MAAEEGRGLGRWEDRRVRFEDRGERIRSGLGHWAWLKGGTVEGGEA